MMNLANEKEQILMFFVSQAFSLGLVSVFWGMWVLRAVWQKAKGRWQRP